MAEDTEQLITKFSRLGLDPIVCRAIVLGLEGEQLSPEPTLALVAFDADSIQSHIFASPRPVTIQGASLTLRQWDRDLYEGGILGHQAVVLFAGGGSAILVVRQRDAGDVRSRLASEFHARTCKSPCTSAEVALSPRELVVGARPGDAGSLGETWRARIGWTPDSGGGFGACMARLHVELRREKGAARPHPFLAEARSGARCEECAERPREAGGERCQRCRTYWDRGRRDKGRWEQARSFEEVLGQGNSRVRDLAFLRLDGKGVGAVLERLQTIGQYHALSQALRAAFEWSDEKPFDLALPAEQYQVPIAGGDDLLLIAPGRWKDRSGRAGDILSFAVDLVDRIEAPFGRPDLLSHFERHPDLKKRVQSIGAGVGIVITSGLPAAFCFDYTETLVKSAKNAIDAEAGARSAFDFVVLRGGTPLSSSLTDLRKRDQKSLDLGKPLHASQVAATQRPYTAASFRDLVARARRLAASSDASRTAIYGLRRAMQEPNEGLITLRYQLARLPRMREALIGQTPLADLPPDIGEWVLSRPDKDGVRASGIPDLLDVLRLVAPETDPAEGARS